MNTQQCLSAWEWLSYLVAVVGVVGTGVGIACAYFGAKLAIKLCAKQQGCVMRLDREKEQTTQDLEEQLRALHAKHPEILRARAYAQKILRDTGEHPAIADSVVQPSSATDTTELVTKPRRDQHDIERDGHK